MRHISIPTKNSVLLMLLLGAGQAVASELLTEEEMRQVAEHIVSSEPYGQQINYLQRSVEQDKDDVLTQRHPALFTERQAALLKGTTTPTRVAEENYRDWLLSGASIPDR